MKSEGELLGASIKVLICAVTGKFSLSQKGHSADS